MWRRQRELGTVNNTQREKGLGKAPCLGVHLAPFLPKTHTPKFEKAGGRERGAGKAGFSQREPRLKSVCKKATPFEGTPVRGKGPSMLGKNRKC